MSIDKKFIAKLGLILFAICAICVFILALCNSLTVDTIAKINLEKAENARIQVLSEADSFEKADYQGESEIYIGKKGDDKVGYCVSAAPKGFGGAIEMMVGIDNDLSITGVTIVNMSETPGLGSKASNEDFIGQYSGMSAKKGEVSVIKSGVPSDNEVVAISGATVTSKAVTDGVNAAIEAVKEMEGLN